MHERVDRPIRGAVTRDRRLTWLLSSSTVSNLGDGIGKVAFPLLAADLTRDPVLIAGLSATQFLPWLMFALLTGALLDRVDRRIAMIAANTARAVVVGGVAALAYFDVATIWLVYAAALLIGTAETVADSAANVLVPSVVDRSGLEGANSKLQAVEIAGQTFLGGPIGSLTFAVFAAFPFLLNSAAFALAAALLLGLAGSYRPRREAPERDDPERDDTVRRQLAEGLRWVRHSPVVFRLVLIAGLVSLTSELAQAQLVLYALEDLELSNAAFGVFAFVGGIGGLAGAAVAPRLVRHTSRLGVLAGGVLLAGAAFTGMGMSTRVVLSAGLFGLFAAGVVALNVVLGTVRHAVVPSELLGRVLGVWRTLVWGAIPVGALLGGVLTQLLGRPSGTFVVSGGLQLLIGVAAIVLLRGHRGTVDRLEPVRGKDNSR
ncbi:Predicted arabinose efflux permease, MFS family [Amycolatopsis arida]|uniref:Predicted arabinose efflux permease, MFS family n=1 Tax=Amycolatopsis arida TaxID=587909 RepID=A0A1I5YLC1_9PSEU|nr:MFS transporter [Amycolatopsis arida]TDX90596.1 putative MFS family arabinose efflux permease [Amycolatopsis arida]SFQ44952.1 Predicted arabinose efflux permease, MFS family [Amycolatopsis arida]